MKTAEVIVDCLLIAVVFITFAVIIVGLMKSLRRANKKKQEEDEHPNKHHLTSDDLRLARKMIDDSTFKYEYLETNGSLDVIYSDQIDDQLEAINVYKGWLIGKYGSKWADAIHLNDHL